MGNITIEQLAKIVGMTTTQLLLRLKSAGIEIKDRTQNLTDHQKTLFLNYLKSSQNNAKDSSLTLSKEKKILRTTKVSNNTIRSSINITVLKHRLRHNIDKTLDLEEEKVKTVSSFNDSSKIVKSEIKFNDTTENTIVDQNKEQKNEIPLQTDNLIKKQKKITPEIKHTIKKKSSPFLQVKSKEKEIDVGAKSVINKVIFIPETISVLELAQKMAIKVTEVIKIMMKMGVVATINQTIDQNTASIVALEMGFEVKFIKESAIEDYLNNIEKTEDAELITRAPIVTIMGHVDHGKTSLLDYIRNTKVVSHEAGGITQHIGAYSVSTNHGMITFLDTPGHEAFTAMRARGTACTDIVVLIVAADDGIMPQTIEAIKHAQIANVPLIVAINKIDKPGVKSENIKVELTKYDIVVESLGGQTMCQEISAKTGYGIDDLLDSILILAEMQELKAPISCLARGVIIEGHLDKGHGAVASILVQKGILHQGDILLAGHYYGKIRAIFADTGEKIICAGPSIPVKVLGLSGIPNSGDEVVVVATEKKAREIALFRQGKYRDVRLAKQQASKLENILFKMKEDATKILCVVLKADVHGSLEAIKDMLNNLMVEGVKINIVFIGVGEITESDVNLALATKGIIIGFNVRANAIAKKLAEKEGIDLRYYSVIYKLKDDILAALHGMIGPKYEERIIGLLEIREIFRSSKTGIVIGCIVLEGFIKRGIPLRILRDNVVIHNGELESLRRFKEDVSEVKQGMECGIGIKNFSDVKIGDKIEIYKLTIVK